MPVVRGLHRGPARFPDPGGVMVRPFCQSCFKHVERLETLARGKKNRGRCPRCEAAVRARMATRTTIYPSSTNRKAKEMR